MGTIFLALILALSGTEASTADASVTVHVTNFAYVPASLIVTPGTVVRFVNDDADAHTVTASGNGFDSGGLDTHDAWAYRFLRPGRYTYFCALHPFMKGTIVVVAARKSK